MGDDHRRNETRRTVAAMTAAYLERDKEGLVSLAVPYLADKGSSARLIVACVEALAATFVEEWNPEDAHVAAESIRAALRDWPQ